MTKFQRKIYTLSFVAIFLVLAPTLIFFAKGYRFDWISKVFVHSGSIIIKSYPKKVDIYVDGKKISNKKLNFINNYYIVNGIRPGRHFVQCKKPGYTDWQKNISVHSGISTEFWNVLLMKSPNDTLRVYSPKNVQRFYLSPREKNELVLYEKNDTDKTISLFNTKTNDRKILYKDQTVYDTFIPNKEENIEWSSNHKKILIPALKENKKDYIINTIKNDDSENNISLLDIFTKLAPTLLKTTAVASAENTAEIMNIVKTNIAPSPSQQTMTGKIPTEKPKKPGLKNKQEASPNSTETNEIYQARWIFDSDSKIILLTKAHQLLIIDIKKPTESLFLDTEVNGFDLAGDHIYYTRLVDSYIWDIKINHPEKKKVVATIPTKQLLTDFVKMIAYDEYRIALITTQKDLYVLNNDPEEDELFFGRLGHDINNVQFSDDGKKLLYWNNNEIFVYMLRDWKVQPKRKKGDTIFITRFSTPITNVQWMQNFENILFTNNNLVKMAETDIRDHINLVDVFKAVDSAQEYEYIYNKGNYVLYFLDSAENKQSLEKKLKSITLIENSGFLNF